MEQKNGSDAAINPPTSRRRANACSALNLVFVVTLSRPPSSGLFVDASVAAL